MHLLEKTTKVEILAYDEKKESWTAVYTDSSIPHWDGFEPLIHLASSNRLTGDDKTQIFLGKLAGSGGYLSFYVIGEDSKGNIKVLLDRMDEAYPNGKLLIDEMKIYIQSNGRIVETLTADDFAI